MILQLKYKKSYLLFSLMTLLVLTSCGSDVEISSKTQKLKLIEALQTIKIRDNSESSLFVMLGDMRFSASEKTQRKVKAKYVEEKSVEIAKTLTNNKNRTHVQTYEKKSNAGSIGYINGTNIIMREGYSSQYKIIGSFKNSGEKVAILDEYISKKTTVLIKKKIKVTDRDQKEHVLPRGKSIEIVAVNPEVDDDILISFKDKNGKRKEGMVYSKTHLDYIKTYWYKVKRNSGEVGWVFGKFITIQ
ncbi:hypothetical protein LNJ08_01435 [Tenacibaculum finnmarkense genomovar ulcerans]|uniref:hypothetical protein n=1 Tax=Tenacibaculum finnmarkense TaxID=2781243 RepID=UPI001E5ED45C|nr:hypothetical protein [Tenacibaculum finnmarkense]MCD8453050.1 hypothetical protein [Tenacibaculum finnmarkense genomovar ulcerans]